MKTMKQLMWLIVAAFAWTTLSTAHVGHHPSIHDVMASVTERFRTTIPFDSLRTFEQDDILRHLTDEERHVLATEYWSFSVDRPVTVTVFRSLRQQVPPYWLAEQGFTPTGDTVFVRRSHLHDADPMEAWSTSFDAGRVGLGIHCFSDRGLHYFVALTPQNGGIEVGVTDMYPGRHTVKRLEAGAEIYRDEDGLFTIDSLPAHLDGHVMLTGIRGRSKDTRLTGIFRNTRFPATTSPADVTLTWSEDPKTTQTIQWRTSTEVPDGVIKYRRKGARHSGKFTTIHAGLSVLRDENLMNDPVNHRFTGVIRGLQAGTAYEYVVGSPAADTWSEPAVFITAPGEVEPFQFIYMGDVQNGFDTWGELARKSIREQPESRFYVIAGDLVNRGNQREDWDDFFHNGAEIFRTKPVLPALGNHEYQGGPPWMYSRTFTLPRNGPQQIPLERAYAIEYSNALFLVLDSNLDPSSQVEWIDRKLSDTDATWTFVVYHHPLYSSGPTRDNPDLRRTWGAVFDRYHVDMALQGHDHAYLRTYPMYDEKRVDSPAEGTIYIVSVAGTKMYSQGDFDYTEVGFTNVSTYQVLDITIDGDRLEYKAYDFAGNLKDEFVIEK